jgi:acyl carrier protein
MEKSKEELYLQLKSGWLLNIISEESGIPVSEINLDMNMEDFDFDSLDYMNISSKIEEVSGVELELKDLYECKTLYEFGDKIEELQ